MARNLTASEKAVFGEDAKLGSDGRPVEQGLGSPANPTHPHALALVKSLKLHNAPATEIAKAEALERSLRGGDDPTQVSA